MADETASGFVNFSIVLHSTFSIFYILHHLFQSRQHELFGRADALLISPLISVGQMDHHFQGEKIGAGHNMARAAPPRPLSSSCKTFRWSCIVCPALRPAFISRSARRRSSWPKFPEPIIT